jgi:enediyne biosynthesis protein E4
MKMQLLFTDRGINWPKLLTIFCCAVIINLLACNKDNKTEKHTEEPTLTASEPLLKLHTGDESGLDFTNYIEETHESNPTNNINIYNGGGLAVGDFDNDKLQDIYFINCNGPNKLFINAGSMKFVDKTVGSGLESPDGFETAATVVDINHDGKLDIYISRAGYYPPDQCRNRLFINQGNLKFTEEAKKYGLDVETRSTGANFFDYDLDGDLDVYILNYPQSFEYTSKIEAKLDTKTNTYQALLKPKTPLDSDRLYRNDNGIFKDVTLQAGVENFAYGLSVTVSDFNGDKYPDIYVGNDFIQPDILYINQKNGTFSNKTAEFLAHCTQHTMGVDIADIDNDGLVDFMGVDMLPVKSYRQKTTLNISSQTRYNSLIDNGYFPSIERNVLQHNNGNGSFSDIGCIAGIYKTDWSWSTLFMDIDNDGFKDIGVTNGYRRDVTDMDFINFTFSDIKSRNLKEEFPNIQDLLSKIPTYKIRNFLFRNKGDWTFEDMSGKWLTVPPSWSNGAAYADFDNDGDLDWVMSNLVDKPFLYENLASNKPDANYLQLKLEGGSNNTLAIGAQVTIHIGLEKQYQELTLTRGIFSSVENIIHFGIGNKKVIDKIEVRWPNGKYTILEQQSANQRLFLKQIDASATLTPTKETALFQSNSQGFGFTHIENNYRDFDNSFLLPWKLSDLGPYITKADFNGDKVEDFFIGNAFDSAPAVFMGNSSGGFTRSLQAALDADKIFEDNQAVAFDADADGDQDLFVVSGGWEATSPLAWQQRLYLNDGKGKFTKSPNAIPQLPDVAAVAAAIDYDSDGDQDLIVCGRVTPNKYPTTPRTSVLRNEKGVFLDVTAQVAGPMAQAGMVTAIQIVDLNGDKKPEIVTAGEWCSIKVFSFNGQTFTEQTAQLGLEKTDGIWSSLLADDIDGDGDQDLVAGNWGLNTRLTASAENPIRLFGNDFDNNGSIDPVPAYYEDGKLYPLYRKDNMIKQMPMLKKKYLYAKAYGSATMEDAFGTDALKKAQNLYAYTLSTTWFENKNGSLIAHALPLQAQVSPTNAIICADMTGDGKKDILLIGNKYGVEVETGRCDAGVSCLLSGDGSGNFKWVPNFTSGIYANKDARSAALFSLPNGQKTIIVGNNNGPIQVYKTQK